MMKPTQPSPPPRVIKVPQQHGVDGSVRNEDTIQGAAKTDHCKRGRAVVDKAWSIGQLADAPLSVAPALPAENPPGSAGFFCPKETAPAP
jgi:hypothetical protein